MAKAIATCTCKKCGAKFEKTAYKANRREADSWITWAERTFELCPDCEEAERMATARQLAAQAEDAGLPALTGTEKQIVWAEQLRNWKLQEIYKEIKRMQKQFERHPDSQYAEARKENLERAERALHWMEKQSDAKYWIDNRDWDSLIMLKKADEQVQKEQEQQHVEMPEVVAEEITVTPENQTEGTVELFVEADRIAARYPKDEKFRAIVRECGLRWDGDRKEWMRRITQFTGTAVDRAADLANRLLRGGFAVCCTEDAVRQKAVSADFSPECDRWVSVQNAGAYSGWLAVSLGADRAMYQEARRLRGAQYADNQVFVPMAQWQIVLDFAEVHGYQVSTGAQRAIEKYETARLAAVTPATPVPAVREDVLQEILQSDDSVLEDLVDE